MQKNPPEALKYFLEVSDVFRGTAYFNYYMNVLVDLARHYRNTGSIKSVEPFKDMYVFSLIKYMNH